MSYQLALSERVFSNVFTGEGERPSHMTLPDGTVIRTAWPDRPATAAYWMAGEEGSFHSISPEEAFAEQLWLHFAYGVPMVDPALVWADEITPLELVSAIASLDTVWMGRIMASYTPDEVVAYAESVAPDVVQLAGVPSWEAAGA